MLKETAIPNLENLPITPLNLLEDNHTLEAQSNVLEWQAAKDRKEHEITVFLLCSDARLVSPIINGDNILTASASTIAAGGDKKPLEHLLTHEAFKQIIVIAHYNGQQFNETGEVVGCGGVDTSKALGNVNEVTDQDGLTEFIQEQVKPDSITQAVTIARQIEKLTDIPVFGVAVDHLTLEAKPIFESIMQSDGQRKVLCNGDIDKPAKERENPLAELNYRELSETFKEWLMVNKESSKRMQELPEFYESQKVQNPKAMVLSTSPIPMAVRYPLLFGKPNRAFVVRLPFEKDPMDEAEIQSGRIAIKDEFLYEAVAQLAYPMTHATNATEGGSFFDTKILIIETPDIRMSKKIANRLIQKHQYVKDWIENKGGKIIVTEVKSGKTIQAEDFDIKGQF